MKDKKERLKRLRGTLVVTLCLLTAASLCTSLIFAILYPHSVAFRYATYSSYALGAVLLCYTFYALTIYRKSIVLFFNRLIKSTKTGRILIENYGTRTILFAAFSAVFNLWFVIFNLIISFKDRLLWNFSLAIYYLILAALRTAVIYFHRKYRTATKEAQDNASETKLYRTCGAILALLPFSLVVPTLQTIFLNRTFIHTGWSIFTFSVYSLVKITSAAVNFIKSRSQRYLTVTAIRNVSFADALVTLFSFQTSILFNFSYRIRNVFNTLSACIVFAVTFTLGVSMVIRNKRGTRGM